MYNYECEYCNKTFQFEKNGQPGAHKRNCLLNPKKNEILKKMLSTKSLLNPKYKKQLNCEKCGKIFEILISENNFSKGKYKKNCSLKCANGRTHNIDTKNKISKTLKDKPKKEKEIFFEKRKCISCNEFFQCDKNSQRKCCNYKCSGSLGGRNSIQSKRSKNESLFYDLCCEKFSNVLSNQSIFNGWDADVILTNEKIAILWNGVWHYKKITKQHSLKQVQSRDKIKIDEIKKCGYKYHIIKDMGRYNPNFVKQEFNLFLQKYDMAS